MRAMEPVVMAIPERQFWRDAEGSIQTQREQLLASNLTAVVSASNIFPGVPDGSPANIQNEQVGCSGEWKKNVV